MSKHRVGVGVIGAGVISGYYLNNMTQFPDLKVRAIADIDRRRSQVRAEEFGLDAMSVPELLASSDIEIVLNLTIPPAHFEVSMQILHSGKHVWSEKPITTTRADARRLLDEAAGRGLRVACAPDTFLGGALQTAYRTILSGRIGAPTSAVAITQSPGPECSHPNPAFFYGQGGGPLLDMGPYHVTALVQTMGAIRRVRSVSSTALATRKVLMGADAGTEFPVLAPSQHMALLEFASGARATLLTSFDSGLRRDLLEIHGTDATLDVPNPNRFAGTGKIYPLHGEPEDVPTIGSTWGRGVGVLDLARALRADGLERANGELAYHVLDVLLSIGEAADAEEPVTVRSTATPPPPLDEDWNPAAETSTSASRA